MKFAVPSWLKNLTRARSGSRAHLVLIGCGTVALVVVVVAFASKEAAHNKTVEARAAATVAATVQQAQQVPSFALPPTREAQPTNVGGGAPATSVAAPAPAPTPTQVAVAPAAVLAPPPGLVAGQVVETISNADQFGQYTAISARAVGSVRTSWQSYIGPAYSPAWRETVTGWFQLSAPATVATLRRGGGAAANLVSAEIDGASLGPPLRGPASEMAALPLAAGWHSFTVTAENKSLSYQATATPIELAIGNGTTPPMPVVPWAAASSLAASAALPAPSTSAAVLPKANTPAPPTKPASVAPPRNTPMGTSTTGAKQ